MSISLMSDEAFKEQCFLWERGASVWVFNFNFRTYSTNKTLKQERKGKLLNQSALNLRKQNKTIIRCLRRARLL